jgi:glycosidase
MGDSSRLFPDNNFAPFLTNHDQDRVAHVLGGDVQKAKAAASLLLSSPGTPFIYYGEEIGMVGFKPDEIIRMPMQWSAELAAGFSSGTPWEGPYRSYKEVNVAAQDDDPDSLLSHYRSWIELRRRHPALRVGDGIVLTSDSSQVYAILRYSSDETLLVLLNLGKKPVDAYRLSLDTSPLRGTYSAVRLSGAGKVPDLITDADGGFEQYQPIPSLEPYSYDIIRYAMK